MNVDRFMRAFEQRVRRLVREQAAAAELGTITGAGLQLDGFPHPIRDWWADDGSALPIGTRVIAVPLAGSGQYYVRGPVTRQGG